MRLEQVDCDEYYIVESPRDLWGWEIIEVEPWKDGVKRLHARRSADSGMEFRLMYCEDSILASVNGGAF